MNMFFSALFRYREKKSPDVLGLYPERVHIEAMPERRYLWTSRIMVIMGVFSICITIMLAMTVYILLPQKKSTPAFYQVNHEVSSLERSVPTEVRGNPQSLLSEDLIGRYIKLRHEVPHSYASLIYRWDRSSEFFQLSTLGTYQQFIYKMDYDAVMKLIDQQVIRKIEIDWIKQLTGELWLAQFRTITTSKDFPDPQTGIWRAYLRVYYVDIKNDPDEEEGVRSYDYTFNPYGFRVKGYSLGYAGTPTASDHYMEIAKKVVEVKNDEE